MMDHALSRLADCTVCPRECHVDRTAGEVGVCGIGRRAVVASYGPHFGEEPPLVGRGGSGTIFFAGCNLLCVFCQNSEISHGRAGRPVDAEELAGIMMNLQDGGCENINLVTPTHVVPQIVDAVEMAEDLSVPIVYNTNSYENLDTLLVLEGIVDIYLPDFKFWNGQGERFMPGVSDYGEVASRAIAEMHRQVGDLRIVDGVAVSGILVRHLVMPGDAADTARIMEYLAKLSRETYVNIMPQYRPSYKAGSDRVIGRRLRHDEFDNAVHAARDAGLRRVET
jgi:putative pyruvate formate lyase activating enzyme